MEEHNCGYADEYHWEYPKWVFTNEGINFIPNYPHAMTACEEPFLLTYKELKEK